MFNYKVKKLEEKYLEYCKNNDYDNINLLQDEINLEINSIIKSLKKDKYGILKFRYLIKDYHNNFFCNRFNLKNMVKYYGDIKYNNLNQIKTKEHILYYDKEISILELKKTNNLNILNIDKIIKKHISNNMVKIEKEDKVIYYLLTNVFTTSNISNYLKIFISKLLYVKNEEINILIGFNSFKPKIFNMKYQDEGLILDYEYFIRFKYINNSLDYLFEFLSNINKDFLIKFQKEVFFKLNLYIDNDKEFNYSATANKKKKELTLYNISYNYEDIMRLLAHEIGHFYYWEYNKNKLDSKQFFKDFKNNFKSIQNKYKNLCYYFQFEPNGKYKFNKQSEYFCEIFSLYLCNELKEEDIEIFEKYIVYL